jgi:hypothetical protein
MSNNVRSMRRSVTAHVENYTYEFFCGAITGRHLRSPPPHARAFCLKILTSVIQQIANEHDHAGFVLSCDLILLVTRQSCWE